jgi:hypothetical protein
MRAEESLVDVDRAGDPAKTFPAFASGSVEPIIRKAFATF